MFRLWPQISRKSAPEKFLRFLAKSTKSGGEHEYGRKPELEVVFAAIL